MPLSTFSSAMPSKTSRNRLAASLLVDETKTHVALVTKVDGQVEEIDLY